MKDLLQKFLNVRIRTKLLAITMVPLLGLTWLALGRAIDRRSEANSAAELSAETQLGVALGNLVHEMQRERGMTSLFVSSKGTKNATSVASVPRWPPMGAPRAARG